MLPERIRVSLGTASVLGLDDFWLDVKPTTAYLMTYSEDGCIANCSFCPQARESPSKKSHLSRVSWPIFSTTRVIEALKRISINEIKRICIQIVYYPDYFNDILVILKAIKKVTKTPISLDTCPLDFDQMKILKDAGLEKIGIPLDAANSRIFDSVKGFEVNGPFTWQSHINALETAVEIYGKGNVLSNLIVGLGETEEEAVMLIQKLSDIGVHTALFAFTPIPRTKLHNRSQPHLNTYRRIQLARHIITQKKARSNEMDFDKEGKIINFGLENMSLKKILEKGVPFRTSGCPGCNRPFYNESPKGPIYNYPRPLTEDELITETARILNVCKC
jgi:biotin synthase